MARLLDWVPGLAIVARTPLTGPRTVGGAVSESTGGYVQTTASPFGLWRWQLAFRGMWHSLFRQYRGLVTALHGGANAVRVPFCDPDLSFAEAGVVTTPAEVAAGKPWETLGATSIAPGDGALLTLGAVSTPAYAFDGITTSAANVATLPLAGGGAPVCALGKSFAPSLRMFGMTVHPSPAGLSSGAAPSITLSLYGRTGAAPATPVDGTLLGQVTVPAARTAAIAVPASDQVTAFAHVWLTVTAGVSTNAEVAELELTGLAPATAPFEDTRQNHAIGRPWVPVVTAAGKATDIIQLAGNDWGYTLAGGEWLGFVPFHFGLYIVTEVFPLTPGRYRIWPPLRKALAVTDYATLSPVMAMRLENEAAASAGRGLALATDAGMTLVEVEDADVRKYFADARTPAPVVTAPLPAPLPPPESAADAA